MAPEPRRRNYRLRTRWDPLTCYTCGVTTPPSPPGRTWDQFWWLEWTCCACGRNNVQPPVHNPKTYHVSLAIGKYPVLAIGFCLLGLGLGVLLVSEILPAPPVHSPLPALLVSPRSPLAIGLGWFIATGYLAMLVFIGVKLACGTWKSFCARLASRFTAD